MKSDDEFDWEPSYRQKVEELRARQKADERAAWMKNLVGALLILLLTMGLWTIYRVG